MFLEFDEKEQRWRDALNVTGRQERVVALAPRRAEPSQRAAPSTSQAPPLAAWENPMVVGLLLALCPPLGVTLAWSARSIPHAGRVALTVFGAFVMLAGTVLGCLMLL